MTFKFTELDAYSGAPDSGDVFALADIDANVNKKLTYANLIAQAVAASKVMGNIITVAESGGQYSDLSDAIDAASESDVIFIYPGSYNLAAAKEVAGITFMGFGLDSKITSNENVVPFSIDDSNKTTYFKNVAIETDNCPILVGTEGVSGDKGKVVFDNCYLSADYSSLAVGSVIPALADVIALPVGAVLVCHGSITDTGVQYIIKDCKFHYNYDGVLTNNQAHCLIYHGEGAAVYAINNSNYIEKGTSNITATGSGYSIGGIAPIIIDNQNDPAEDYFEGIYHNNEFTMQVDPANEYTHRLMGVLGVGVTNNCYISGGMITLLCEDYSAATRGYMAYLDPQNGIDAQNLYMINVNVKIFPIQITRHTARVSEVNSDMYIQNGSINEHATEDVQSGDGQIHGTALDKFGAARLYVPPFGGFVNGQILSYDSGTERFREVGPGLEDQVLTSNASGIPYWDDSRIRNWYRLPDPVSGWAFGKTPPSSFGYSYVDRGQWAAGITYSVGDMVYSNPETGYLYECLIGGTSTAGNNPTAIIPGSYQNTGDGLRWMCRTSNVIYAGGLAGSLDSVKVHIPIKIKIGSTWYYGQLLKFTEGPTSYIEFAGPSDVYTNTIDEVWVGAPYLMTQGEINIPTTYGDGTTKTLLLDDTNTLKKYGRRPDGYVVGLFMQHIVAAGTVQPLMNLTLNGNTVIQDNLNADVDGGMYPAISPGQINYPTAININNYKITQGQLIDVSCEVVGTPTSGARYLLVCYMLVLDYVN